MTTTRQTVQAAVDDYFSGKISVDEAFRRAYGPDTRKNLVVSGVRQENTDRGITREAMLETTERREPKK